jgi:hypothetical protein
MKTIAIIALFFLTSPAFAITKVKVPTLPQSEWADTEVMTNVTINLSNSRTFSWRLEMDASPTNNVLMGVGPITKAPTFTIGWSPNPMGASGKS